MPRGLKASQRQRLSRVHLLGRRCALAQAFAARSEPRQFAGGCARRMSASIYAWRACESPATATRCGRIGALTRETVSLELDSAARRRRRRQRLRRRRLVVLGGLLALAAVIALPLALRGQGARTERSAHLVGAVVPPEVANSTRSLPRRVSRLVLPVRLPARTLKVPILMYHRVGYVKASSPTITRALTVSPETFASEMRWIAGHGFHAVTQQAGLQTQGGQQVAAIHRRYIQGR